VIGQVFISSENPEDMLGACYSTHQMYRLLSCLIFGRTPGLAVFPSRANKFSVESETILKPCFMGLDSIERLYIYPNSIVVTS